MRCGKPDRRRPGGRRRPGLSLASAMLLALCLSGGLWLSSCSEDKKDEGGGGTIPGLSAAELNELGWEGMDAGAYLDARANFEAAVEKDSGLAEARLGLGWALAYTGAYADAEAAFEELLSGSHATDAYAGRAAAVLAIDAALAISSAQTALERDAAYAFYKRPSFDYRDLHLILAEAYFDLAQYANAQNEVDVLNPENGLDPQAPDYPEALSTEIERLSVLLAYELPG